MHASILPHLFVIHGITWDELWLLKKSYLIYFCWNLFVNSLFFCMFFPHQLSSLWLLMIALKWWQLLQQWEGYERKLIIIIIITNLFIFVMAIIFICCLLVAAMINKNFRQSIYLIGWLSSAENLHCMWKLVLIITTIGVFYIRKTFDCWLSFLHLATPKFIVHSPNLYYV